MQRLLKIFNPSKFCAERIVQLAKNSGMKYLVITAKHHDGFALYDSECSQYDIMDATPYKKDIVKDLYEACNRHGIHFGIYYSHNLDWADGSDCGRKELLAMKNYNPEDISKMYGSNFWDPSPNTFEEYLNNKAYPQVKELLTKYPNMVQLWYDMPHYVTQQQSYNFYKIAYDLQPQMLINSRVGNDFGDFEVAGDNKVFDKAKETPWQTVGTLNNSWGYKWYDNDWKSPKEVLLWLVEIVSKGGNYMLNIGPKGSGEVPEESVKTLLKVGEWMHVNGEAIYGSKAWTVNHEGPTDIQMNGTLAREKEGFNKKLTSNDFWFTQKMETCM
jgi:Alpha-L-fucosidase